MTKYEEFKKAFPESEIKEPQFRQVWIWQWKSMQYDLQKKMSETEYSKFFKKYIAK